MAGKISPEIARIHRAIRDEYREQLLRGVNPTEAQLYLAAKYKRGRRSVQDICLGIRNEIAFQPAEVVPPPVADPQLLTHLKGEVTRLKTKTALLEDEKKELDAQLKESNIYKELFGRLEQFNPHPPEWLQKAKKGNTRISIPTAMLSDLHLDEVVRPEQVNFVNAYDRTIAEKRLKLFFENTIELSFEYLTGLKYGGIVLPFAGDIFSGNIHEELKETNIDTLFGSVLYWIDPMIAGIKMLADAFGKVYIPCVVGNHGRMTRKPRAKFRAQDNIEYLFNKVLQKFLKDDKRITFQVSDAADLPYTILSTRYLETHGDQFRGGTGIAGLLSPLMLGDHRKRKRQQALSQPFDVMILGHWHTLTFLGNMIINGSLKGFDEYAYISNFSYEPPQQAFWITDEKYGVTVTAPIHCQEAESYGELKESDWLKAA